MLEALKGKFGREKKVNTLVGKTVQVGANVVKVECLLGEGGFACIYKVRDVKDQHEYALKHMRLSGDHDAINEVKHEAKTMAQLKGHPNVLRLHAVAFGGPQGGETDGFMLMDYCPRTLISCMQECNHIVDDKTLIDVFSDVCKAVFHMHQQNPPICHRDLKVENVLQLPNGRWVICDFGSATTRAKIYATPSEIADEENNIRRTTTPAYRAPEMWDLYSRVLIDTKADIWALGVMLFVLAFGKLPFAGDSRLQILYGKYDMPPMPARTADLRSLIKDMLCVDPSKRPDIACVISKFDFIVQSMQPPMPEPPAAGGYISVTSGVPRTASPLPMSHSGPGPTTHMPGPSHGPPTESLFDLGERPNLSAPDFSRMPSSGLGAGGLYPAPNYDDSPNDTPGPAASSAPSSTSDAFGDSTNWANFADTQPAAPPPVPAAAAPPPAAPTPPAPPPAQPAPPVHRTTTITATTTAPAPIAPAPVPAAHPAQAAAVQRAAAAVVPPPPAQAQPVSRSSSSTREPPEHHAADMQPLRRTSVPTAVAVMPDSYALFRDEVRGDLDALRRQLKEVMEANYSLTGRVRNLEDVVSTQRTVIARLQTELAAALRPGSHRGSGDGYGLLDTVASPQHSSHNLLVDTGMPPGISQQDYPHVGVIDLAELAPQQRQHPQQLL